MRQVTRSKDVRALLVNAVRTRLINSTHLKVRNSTRIKTISTLRSFVLHSNLLTLLIVRRLTKTIRVVKRRQGKSSSLFQGLLSQGSNGMLLLCLVVRRHLLRAVVNGFYLNGRRRSTNYRIRPIGSRQAYDFKVFPSRRHVSQQLNDIFPQRERRAFKLVSSHGFSVLVGYFRLVVC